MGFFPDADDELAFLEKQVQDRHASASRVGMAYNPQSDTFTVPTEQQGARLYALVHDLSEYQRKYWWLKPQLQWAMAQTGIAPDSATAKAAAEVGAKIEADSGFGFKPMGSTTKAALAAANIAATGQGAGYGGSYDWGNVVRDLSAKDRSYITHYGEGGSPDQQTLAANGVEVPLSGAAAGDAQTFLRQQGVNVSSEMQKYRDSAKKTVSDLAPRVGSLSPSEHAAYFSAQQTATASDEEIKAQQQGVDVFGAFTPAARGAFMVLGAPLQEVQGQIRNVYAAAHGESPNWLQSQSDLGVAADQIWNSETGTGNGIDVGTGIFVDPTSKVAEERHRRERERGVINGHSVTAGRWLADAAPDFIVEPGSTQYNVLSGAADFAVAVALDPANLALGALSKAREGSKLFTEAGGILGLRREVSPLAVEKFWDGAGQQVAQQAAGLTNTYDVMEAFGRKLPPHINAAIADESDPTKIIDILKPLSGGVLREKPTLNQGIVARAASMVTGDQIGAVRSRQSVRLLNTMPGQVTDLEDPVNAVLQVERSLRNIKAPESMVYEFVDKMSRAPDKIARFGVLEDMWGGAKGMLVEAGLPPERAHKLTEMFVNGTKDSQKYFVDEIGGVGSSPLNNTSIIDGQPVVQQSPHLLVEHINRMVPMPQARELRRATSKFAKLWSTENQQLVWPAAMALYIQDNIWKPAALFRGALTLRVIGEEQVRMAAMGLDSLISGHPLQAIAVITGRKRATSFLGESLQDASAELGALSRGSGGLMHAPNQVPTGAYTIAYKTEEQASDYLRGWAGELAQLHADPVARAVAQFDTLDAAKGWFRSGDGETFRQQLARAGSHGHDELLTDVGADAYIESISKRISIKTGDNPTLLEAIKTGKMPLPEGTAPRSATAYNPAEAADPGLIAPGTKYAAGHDLYVPTTTKLNSRFVDSLKPHLESGPPAVKTPTVRFVKGDALKERYDRAVEGVFGLLMSSPTNKLSRSPTFNQLYWNRAPELLPLMTEDAQRALLAEAKKAGVGLTLPKTSGTLDIEHADLLAKGHALDGTKNLLYDLSQRSQFFDATRLFFPFGEAWKEVATRWAKIAYNRPQNIRRFQQVMEGARGPGFGDTVTQVFGGQPTGQGFFHKNERGEEVFTYPGSEWLTSKLIGVPIPLQGKVSGLNMVGQIYPGLGPMAQIPVAALLPDSPKYDDIRNILFPYGEPGDPRDPMEDIKTFAPPWMKRVLSPEWASDPDSLRLHANSVMDITRYLASTGDYDLNTPEGVQKMVSDAKAKAGQFSWIRGIAQNLAPSSPSPDFLVKDKDGRLVQTMMLAQEYRALQNEDYATASQKFLDKYGTEPFLVMQSKTQAVSYGYPVSSDGLTWMRENPDAEKKFPNVFGFFAPQGGAFDYNAYLRALETGAKTPLTPEQFVALGNARLASIEYDKAKQKVQEVSGGKPSDAQRSWLRQMQDALIRQYPGYGPSLDGGLGLTQRADRKQQMRELQDVMKDPKLANTETGKALTSYLQARDRAQAVATAGNLAGFQSAKAARPVRDWLRQMGEALGREHPSFVPLWEQILQREMADDTDVEQVAR